MAAEDQVALTGRNTTLHHKENHLVTSVWRPRNPPYQNDGVVVSLQGGSQVSLYRDQISVAILHVGTRG